MSRPVRHPSTDKLFKEAAARFAKLQKYHRIASDYMWAGMLASQFTADELALLVDYLSPKDAQLITATTKART